MTYKVGISFCFYIFLIGISIAITAAPENNKKVITIYPSETKLKGDVVTQSNTAELCIESLLKGVSEKGVILGANPESCNSKNWKGGSIYVNLYLEAMTKRTIYTLNILSKRSLETSIISANKDALVQIHFNSELIWTKRPYLENNFSQRSNDSSSITTTFVISRSGTYSITLTAPPATAWFIDQISLIPSEDKPFIRGICYSPYRDCQYPGGQDLPDENDMREDLIRLYHSCNAIRTYGASAVEKTISKIAHEIGLPFYAGAWIDGNSISDSIEIQNLITIANLYQPAGLIIGNEYIHRHHQKSDNPDANKANCGYLFSSKSDLLKYIRKVRKSLNNPDIPITIAELDYLMFIQDNDGRLSVCNEFKSIIKEIDFIMIHIYPFWGGRKIDDAANSVIDYYKKVKELLSKEYPGKGVIIGETGWPSDGENEKEAIPSQENQSRYLSEFLRIANKNQVDFTYFDSFSELWKIEEGLKGQHWGYCYTDRSAKYDFHGVILDTAYLPPFTRVRYLDAEQLNPFYDPTISNGYLLYDEWPSKTKFVPSGWMGDFSNMEIDPCNKSNPYKGKFSFKVNCRFKKSNSWMGIYWLPYQNKKDPIRLWGGTGLNIPDNVAKYLNAQEQFNYQSSIKNSLNILDTLQIKTVSTLQNSNFHFTFAVRGETGGERVEFGVGGINKGKNCLKKKSRWVTLDTTWQQITFPIKRDELKEVVGGFFFTTSKSRNRGKKSVTFYLDKIAYIIL